MTYYCWHCYGMSSRARGTCEHCGSEIAAPEDTSFDARLIWALGHPLPGRQMAAISALGKRRVAAARGQLAELVHDADPYLAAAALEALARIDGPERYRSLLATLSISGPPQVRHVAERLSAQLRDGTSPT